MQASGAARDAARRGGTTAAALLPRIAPWLSALVTLLVVAWRMGVPSFWRDEGATLSAVHRSFPQLISLLGRMDAVHGAYYALMWPEVRLARPAVRAPETM